MKTPRQAFKENFWIGAKGGLIDDKHVKAMGDAVWLFLYLLRGQTAINERGEGIFDYGHPHTLKYISGEFDGTSERTIQRWILRLRKTGYIQTESHSENGLTFWIAKAKNKTKNPKVTNKVRAKSAEVTDSTPYAERVPSESHSIRESRTESVQSIRDSVKESPQPVENAIVAAPIPKGSIPKDLSYYNKPAAAKTAAVISSLSRGMKRELQPQRLPVQERQKILDEQAVMILDKYSPGWRKATATA